MCMDDTNWTFYNSYFYFFGGSHQGGERDMKGLGGECDQSS